MQAVLRPTYSASIVERAISVCSLDLHSTGQPNAKIIVLCLFFCTEMLMIEDLENGSKVFEFEVMAGKLLSVFFAIAIAILSCLVLELSRLSTNHES